MKVKIYTRKTSHQAACCTSQGFIYGALEQRTMRKDLRSLAFQKIHKSECEHLQTLKVPKSLYLIFLLTNLNEVRKINMTIKLHDLIKSYTHDMLNSLSTYQ